MNLTRKQEIFCQEYAASYNGSASALKAGYAVSTVAQQASRLLKDVKIKGRIAEILNISQQREGITLYRIMSELALIAFGSTAGICEWDAKTVTLTPSHELTEDQKKLIESVGETSARDGSPQVKIKLHSKLRALDVLLRAYEISEVEIRLAKIEEKLELS